MQELRVGPLGCQMDWLENYIGEVVSTFLSDLKHLPSESWSEEVNKSIKVYVDGLGHWVRGNDDWSFESHRYYGTEGEEVKKHRTVTLQPPQQGFAPKTAAKLV